LSAAQDKIKQEELAARGLQATIDTLSYQSDDFTNRTAKLEREKTVAEARIRELEANLRQATAEPSATIVSRIPGRGRKRSSSVSPSLQQELNDVRAVLSKKEADLRVVTDKLTRTQTDLTRVSNEKIAMEKRMQTQLEALQASYDEKEEELQFVKEQQGDGGLAREEELLQRVEEDEAKILALEMLLRDSGDNKQLKQTLKKAADAEARQIELVKEKEQALDELENAQEETKRLQRIVCEKEAGVEALDVKTR
jgi:DNA repair exonuclease SbcCD ATPase subunit